jgi:hypothetical protein
MVGATAAKTLEANKRTEEEKTNIEEERGISKFRRFEF